MTGGRPFGGNDSEGAMIPVRRGVLVIPTRPLQSPSLEHFDVRVVETIEHERTVEGLREMTLAWAGRSYRSLRSYLVESRKDDAFLSGDVERQLEVLQGWVAWLRLREVSRVSINNYWRGVSSLFRWMSIREGTVNPLAYVAAPRVGRINPKCLTRMSAEAVLEFVRHHDWRTRLAATRNLAIMGLMLLAGLRRGELRRLKNGDVDMENGTIRIIAGKGRYGGKDRTCYMPPQLHEMLAAYIVERRRAGRTHVEFLTSSGANRGVTEQPIRRVCDITAKALGVRLSPHMLRHTYATLLRQAGVPDRVSMDLLGHTSLAMLQRYSHVFSGEHLREASKLHLDFDPRD